jgi:hypothetical protein
MNTAAYSEGWAAPASITRKFGHKYRWLRDGNIYEQIQSGVGNNWVLEDPTTVPPHALNDHTDVNVPTPSDGQVLTYQSGAGWIAADTGGGANAVYLDAALGNDTTGTRGDDTKPFKSITAARDAAVFGDTIFVKAGSYSGVDLGRNGVAWYFHPNTFVTPSDNFTAIWQDNFGWAYTVKGYGNFGDAFGEANNYIVRFFASNSQIDFECNNINHKCNQAVVYLANNVRFKAHGTVNNANTGDVGGVLWTTGFVNQHVEANLWSTQVNGVALFNSPNGTIWYNAGFTGKGVLKGDMQNFGTTKSGSNIQSRTGSTGTWEVYSNITDTASTATTFYSAVWLYNAGDITHIGDVTKANASAFYSNNIGAVNFFHHKEGTYIASNGNAIRFHDGLAKDFQFDGNYDSDGGADTIGYSGNNTGQMVNLGKDARATVRNRAGAGTGVRLSTTWTMIMGDVKIICDDVASGISIDTNAAINLQIDGKVVSNVDKDVLVTPLVASTFDFNAGYQI